MKYVRCIHILLTQMLLYLVIIFVQIIYMKHYSGYFVDIIIYIGTFVAFHLFFMGIFYSRVFLVYSQLSIWC